MTSFDEYYDPFGIVRATFSIPQGIVSIDAKLVLAPGSYGYPLYNRPYLKAYDANGNLLGAKYYSIANHTQYPRFFPYQTLTFTTPANNIAYVELSAEAPQGDTTARVYGEFDNLQFGYDPVATSMQVTTPSSAADGTPFNMTVTCLDQHGYPFPSFTGTVHFTSSDTQAGLPADYTFTAADAGTHTFPVTLNTPGVQTVTAADSADGLQATSPGIAVSVGPATHFRVTASATGTAGIARSFTVTALDADNNVATGYTGTVHFSSTDLKATLPAAYAFTAADGGTHQFSVTLKTAGSQTVTVTGTDLPAGAVGAWRAEGNAQDSVGGNNGTLQGGATFAPGEAGQAFNFNGNGQYVTVPYSPGLALNTFTVAAWVNLGANPGDFGILGTRVGGEYTFDLQILAGKVHGDVGTGSGWINTSVDYPATLPPGTWHLITYVIDNGAKRFSLYLDGALQGNPISFTGTPLFMAPGETLEIGYGSLFQDYFNGRIDEVQIYNRALGAPEVQGIFVNGSAGEFQPIVYTAPVTVSPAAATTLSITGLPSSTVAGTAVSFTVTAYDAYGNVATGYAGTVHFTGTDAMATLPADYTFTGTDAGRHTFSVTFQTAGTQSITATDKATSSIAGTTSVVVSASSATATFVKQDATTQGTWIGTYGAQGYDVINSSASLPSYATVAPSGQASYTWAAATTDPRALQVPGTTNRIAACWYSPTGFSVDLNLTDGQKHNLELYLLDWDSTSRAETVQVSDAASGAVLSTQSVSSFHAGAYLDYTVSGHVVITFTRTAGANAVLSGLFIG